MSRLRKERRDKRRQEEANRRLWFVWSHFFLPVLVLLLAVCYFGRVVEEGLSRYDGSIVAVRRVGSRHPIVRYDAEVGREELLAFEVAHWLSEPGPAVKVGDVVDLVVFDGVLGRRVVELWVNGDCRYTTEKYLAHQRNWLLIGGVGVVWGVVLAANSIARGRRHGLTLRGCVRTMIAGSPSD